MMHLADVKFYSGGMPVEWRDEIFMCNTETVVTGTTSGIPDTYTFVTASGDTVRDPSSWSLRLCQDDVCVCSEERDVVPPLERGASYSTYDLDLCAPTSAPTGVTPTRAPTTKQMTSECDVYSTTTDEYIECLKACVTHRRSELAELTERYEKLEGAAEECEAIESQVIGLATCSS